MLKTGKGTPSLYRSPVIFYQWCCQNLPIDGVRELAEEYTTTTFFTILTNKTLLKLPSQGGEGRTTYQSGGVRLLCGWWTVKCSQPMVSSLFSKGTFSIICTWKWKKKMCTKAKYHGRLKQKWSSLGDHIKIAQWYPRIPHAIQKLTLSAPALFSTKYKSFF